MNRNKPNKQPRPSYEEGKLRDPRIAEMQDKDFTRDDFMRIVKKATTKRPESAAEQRRVP